MHIPSFKANPILQLIHSVCSLELTLHLEQLSGHFKHCFVELKIYPFKQSEHSNIPFGFC